MSEDVMVLVCKRCRLLISFALSEWNNSLVIYCHVSPERRPGHNSPRRPAWAAEGATVCVVLGRRHCVVRPLNFGLNNMSPLKYTADVFRNYILIFPIYYRRLDAEQGTGSQFTSRFEEWPHPGFPGSILEPGHHLLQRPSSPPPGHGG